MIQYLFYYWVVSTLYVTITLLVDYKEWAKTLDVMWEEDNLGIPNYAVQALICILFSPITAPLTLLGHLGF